MVGALLNFAVAWSVALATAPPPEAVRRLVADIRVPAGVARPHDH